MKYLYCITKSRPVDIELAGLNGAPIHGITHGDLTCFVSDTDTENIALSREAAITHEKVLESIMEQTTIVPMSFGHVVQSVEQVKEKLLTPYQEKLDKTLADLEGKIELSLKLFWLDLDAVLTQIAQSSPEIKNLQGRKRVSRDAAMRAGEIASKMLGRKRQNKEQEIVDYFSSLALAHKSSKLFGDQMVTNLAFLTRREDLSSFDELVNQYAGTLSDNHKVKYTGPVPPFNFVDLRINLEASSN
jgi:hypothetical protein